ncbi:MAG: MFS transporter [Ardenticatenales bacterium]|nr:MFS transporter [Ardenticatenales bacterium]
MTRDFHLPRWQMILYASGSLAVALSYQSFATYIQFVYIDVLGLAARWVGLAWAIYGVWNAINDPLSGYWSDKTQTRWGRRIPWIAGSFLPLGITFYFLWSPPAGLVAAKGTGLLLYFLGFVLLFDLFWTIVVMNWTALFPEMVPDDRERAVVSAWRQIFSLIGLLIGVALPPVLAGADWSNRGGMALLLTVVTVVFFALSLLGSRERGVFQQDETLPFGQALRATLANRDFLYFLGANLAIQFIFMMLAATVPFYTKYALNIREPLTLANGFTLDPELQTSLFLAVAFIMAMPAMPVWTKLAQRWGARVTLQVCCLTTAAALLVFFWAANFYGGILGTAILGINFAGLLMLTDLLIADMVDADELTTGARREGMYFGMNGFVIRFAFTIQGFITGAILTLSGYISPANGDLYPVQPAAAVMGIRWMIAGIPAIAAILACLILLGYSLHGQKLADVQSRVAALHRQKTELQTPS